jgi:hypothetical protein
MVLPFMPECVRYVGCKAIKLAGGLFVPCGGKTKTEFCASCTKKATEKGTHEYGTLAERQAAHDNGDLYTVGDKTEITFGDYMVSKKLDQATVKASLRDAGLSLNIPMRCLAVVEGAKKKRSGRPTKKAEAAPDASSDEEAAAPQPKAPRVKLTVEEQVAKAKAEIEAKAIKAAERDAKIAENKAKREAQKAEAAAKKAEKDAKKAAAPEPEKKEKKAKKAAAVQQQMDALDEPEDFKDARDEQKDTHEEPEEFKAIKQKGAQMKHYVTSGKVFEMSDATNTMLLGKWNEEKSVVNFEPNMAACMVVTDQIKHEIDAGKSSHKFMMAGNIFTVDFKEQTVTTKKATDVVLHIAEEDGELHLRLGKAPEESEEEEEDEDNLSDSDYE